MKAIKAFLNGHEKSDLIIALLASIVFAALAWWSTNFLPWTLTKVITGVAVFAILLAGGCFFTKLVEHGYSANSIKPQGLSDDKADMIAVIIALIVFFAVAWWSTNFLPKTLIKVIAGVAVFAILFVAGYASAKLTKERFSTDGDKLFN